MTQATRWFAPTVIIIACATLSAQDAGSQQLMNAMLSCMVDGAAARDDLRNIKLSGVAAADSLETMTSHRSVIRRFVRCNLTAAGLPNGSKEIGVARDALSQMSERLATSFERSLKFQEKLLTITSESQLRAVIPEASEINDNIDAAWRLYMPVAGIVAHAIVNLEKPNAKGELNRLTLTRSQIVKLRTELREWFPDSAKSGDKHVVDATARMLSEFLAQPWLASDEK